MMKFKMAFVSLLSGLLPMTGMASPEWEPLSKQFHIPEGTSAVVSMQDQAMIAIIGPINSNVLVTYRDLQAKSGATTLFIDSGGGDVASAIALANDLRQHGTRLVVAGRCFSACANYIFAGSLYKTVLPGSLVAIHDSQLVYYAEKNVISFAQRHKQELEQLDKNGSIKKQIADNAKMEAAFFPGLACQ